MENKKVRDVFKIITPERDECRVIRVPLHTYDQLVSLNKTTGVSVCRITEQCVAFALERLEEGNIDDNK